MARWDVYYTVTNLEDAVDLLDENAGDARIIAGGTDLMLEIRDEVRTPSVLIDITRVGGLDEIRLGDDGRVHLGPMVSHAQAAASPLLQERALPLAQTCWGVGGPQLRNRGTIAGNLITATPANDTITTLQALEAEATLTSARGERTVSVEDFCTHVRCNIMEPDEILTDIAFAPLTEAQRGIYLKLRPRKLLAIASVNVTLIVTLSRNKVTDARITLGAVAPTIVRAREAEEKLIGGPLSDERIEEVAEIAVNCTEAIDDVRGSAWFREEEVVSLVRRGLRRLRDGDVRQGLPKPEEIVLLWGKSHPIHRSGRLRCRPRLSGPTIAHHTNGEEPIQCTVNGENFVVHGANGKTLLHMLRDDLGLTGTKAGCEAGECGSCTVWLDGIAILACLTPAPRAHGASILTIEGLASEEELHPVQQAFIDEDATQCGYCTPGFVMSAANLLEEHANPTQEQIIVGLSGNLCRCTGYYKIISAVERAVGGTTTSEE